LSLNIRADFVNVLNRGFGYINLAAAGTQAGQPRNGTLVARFAF